MSDITPESPHYQLGSLVTRPDASALLIVDQHSQLERKQLLPVLLPAQSRQL